MSGEEPTQLREGRRVFFSLVRGSPVYAFGLVVVVVYLAYSLVVGLFPSILHYNPSQVNLAASLQPPSFAYPFGTDDLGRSVFMEVLYGAPIDAGVSLAIVLFSFVLGVVSGSLAA